MELRICWKTFEELNKLLELRSQIDIDLHVEQVRKKVLFLLKDCSLSSLGIFKQEIFEEKKWKTQWSWRYGVEISTNIRWNYRRLRLEIPSHKKNRLFPKSWYIWHNRYKQNPKTYFTRYCGSKCYCWLH